MSGPWKRRYRPTVTEQDQNELILRLVFLGGTVLSLAALTVQILT